MSAGFAGMVTVTIVVDSLVFPGSPFSGEQPEVKKRIKKIMDIKRNFKVIFIGVDFDL